MHLIWIEAFRALCGVLWLFLQKKSFTNENKWLTNFQTKKKYPIHLSHQTPENQKQS